MGRLNPNEVGALLLPWLKANAEEMARELRDAGWDEDESGLWRRAGKCQRMHLFDAHAALTRGKR